MFDSEGRLRMKTAVQRLAAHRHVLCFQEVHGKEGEFLDTFRKMASWLEDLGVGMQRGR